MYRIIVIIFMLFSEHNCDQSDYAGTVLNIGEDTVVGEIDFETEQDDWTVKNMKIVDTDDSIENVDNIPGEGHFAVPQLSMSGNEWGQLYAIFRIPAFTRVAVEFSVFVSGFDPEAENTFLSNNPDLLVSLAAVNTSSQQRLTNLRRLNPQNNLWNRYRTEVQTGGGLRFYRVSLEAVRGRGVIALDWVKVEIVPVVGETGDGRGNRSDDTITNVNTKPDIPEDDEVANMTLEPVFPNNSFSGNNLMSSNLSSIGSSVPEDTSVYGYTGEVVLICLAIMLIILFLGMVYKYHRLKSHVGEYQLDQGGSRQDSHDNQGYDVQMSYRVED